MPSSNNLMVKVRFPFCPKCGGKTSAKPEHGKERIVCTLCGYVRYRNPVPTASALFIKNGSILLTKRAIDPKKGFWDLPGGFIEEDEHPEKALHREIKEELGVEITIGKLFDIVMDWYEFGGDRFSTLNLYYFAKMASEQITPADDITEAQWFSIKNPPKNLSSENNRIILAKLRSTIL
ncbi:MAG: NUDIX hydrolase [Candidatus Portnoybacteria bacterium]|nr:NUDIX hydrolase [Candidatus Portnoybacteria bacterium]